MDLDKGITGEARTLVQEHQEALERLPRTFLVNTLVELEKWPMFFEPERKYFRALISYLAALDPAQSQQIFGRLAAFEQRTGAGRVRGGALDATETETLNYIQRHGEYSNWRQEIDRIFAVLDPALEARLYSGDLPPRLVVILYGEGIAIERTTLWKRFRSMGVTVPLDLAGAGSSGPFLRALFTGRPAAGETIEAAAHPPAGGAAGSARADPTLFQILHESGGFAPFDTWIVEAGDALHRLLGRGGASAFPGANAVAERPPAAFATGMSYDLLRDYRDELTHTIWAKVEAGLRSPLELAAYVKTLEIRPGAGVTLNPDPVMLAFIRDTFLAGNGTLIINNTFVEWGAVRALKRCQPRMLVARFGVRDKMKPFSSLLLFSKPRPTDQIPIMQDPLGSFVDSELLAYYVWLNAEKGPPYKGRTLYVLLAEGVDEMLVLASGSGKPPSKTAAPATLPDVGATLARWLGVTMPGSPGRPIAAVL